MAQTTSEIQIGWQDYLAIAHRRRPFFVTPLCVALAIGALYCLFAPRVYEANAVILVQNEKLINPLIQGLAMPTAVSDRLQTLREEILSYQNLSRVVIEHHLLEPHQQSNQVALDRMVKQLREVILVKMRARSLIEVSYQGRDRSKVQELVNALSDIVINRDAAIQREESNAAINFIEEELQVYRKKLEDSETKLREFKELYLTQMPVAAALNSQLKDLEVQLSNLLVDNTEEHPRVVDVKRKINEVRRQRDEEIKRLVAKGVLGGQDAKATEEMLNQMSGTGQSAHPQAQKVQQAVAGVVAGFEAPEVSVPTGPKVAIGPDGTTTFQVNDAAATNLTLAPRQQQELASLTRDYSVNEQIYRGLLEKLEHAKITGRLGEDEQGGKFVVIEQARYPLKPVSPKPEIVMLMALVFGLAFGVMAVMAAEYLDQSVQSSDEVAELLGVPVLGAISAIVTQGDLKARHQRRKQWTSLRKVLERLKASIVGPVWTRIDKALVHWGL